MKSTTTEPMTLKSTCPMAVRRAARLPLREARIGVMVVPMLPPRMTAQPKAKDIQPCDHMMRVMAKVAADDCTTMVRMMPTAKNISTDQMPKAV